jgi:hypothetical protein
MPSTALIVWSARSLSTCENRLPPVRMMAKKASAISTAEMAFGEVRPSGSAPSNSRSRSRSKNRAISTSPPHPVTGLSVYATGSDQHGRDTLFSLCIVLFLPNRNVELAKPSVR